MKPDHAKFVGSIPDAYDEGLGPVIFAPYARELAARAARGLEGTRVLEVACGTGVATRALLAALPPSCSITATDLNQAMVDRAQRVTRAAANVTWRAADAMELPFADGGFDAVVCQFGLMFVPDRARALGEMARVLRPGGALHASVWCSLDENPFGRLAHRVVGSFFRSDPPAFYEVPFSFHDPIEIGVLLRAAGFSSFDVSTVELEAVAPSVRDFARGLVEGNPIAASIAEAKLDVAAIRAAVERALVELGGEKPFRSTMRARVIGAKRK
jgi:ubiquinone/menaquinone biosynthesis C-methylase UbiE